MIRPAIGAMKRTMVVALRTCLGSTMKSIQMGGARKNALIRHTRRGSQGKHLVAKKRRKSGEYQSKPHKVDGDARNTHAENGDRERGDTKALVRESFFPFIHLDGSSLFRASCRYIRYLTPGEGLVSSTENLP